MKTFSTEELTHSTRFVIATPQSKHHLLHNTQVTALYIPLSTPRAKRPSNPPGPLQSPTKIPLAPAFLYHFFF